MSSGLHMTATNAHGRVAGTVSGWCAKHFKELVQKLLASGCWVRQP